MRHFARMERFKSGKDDPVGGMEWELSASEYLRTVEFLMQFGPGVRIE